jgi:hypothetical protein
MASRQEEATSTVYVRVDPALYRWNALPCRGSGALGSRLVVRYLTGVPEFSQFF